PHSRGFRVSVTETASNLIFTGPLTWTGTAACRGQNDLFFAPAGERPETRNVREAKARAVCNTCAVLTSCRQWAREHREYGFWGGESEEDRAAAGFRVDMPVGRVARDARGDAHAVQPRHARSAEFWLETSARGRERSAGGGVANWRERRAPAGG